MEASKASEFFSQNQSHGSSQRSPRRSARPLFVPKKPPRPRQRGALPRPVFETDEEASSTQQQRDASSMPYMEQQFPRQVPQRGSSRHPIEEQTSMRQTGAPVPEESWQGHYSMQSGMIPQQRGSSMKRQNPAPLQRDCLPSAAKFSRSWHRVSTQEQSHQRGAMPLAPEHSYRSRQRGAIWSPSQEFSFTGTPSSLGTSLALQSAPQGPRVLQPFLETKTSFLEMWLQLEAAIQSREKMLMDMKAEMEKSLSQVKNSKVDALREKEEVEARKTAVLKNMENVSTQTGKLKSVRESLEKISTDLSVQVAELNQSLQQVQEQQRVLRVLESLYDVSENEENNFVDKKLQECEVKLATMERELASSKQTSELLEKAALKRIGALEEIEAGCVVTVSLDNEASGNLCVVQPKHQINTDRIENFSETRIDAGPFGLNGEQELLGHAPALKRPKMEPMG